MTGENLNDRAKEISELVSRVQKGDMDAFSKLYDIFVDPIYRYVFYKVKSVEVEDIVETVFLRVWQNVKQYKAKQGSFSSWIFRIAHNLVVDYYRKSKEKETLELDIRIADSQRQHNPIRIAEDSLDQHVLKVGLTKLKKVHQEILIYKFINDLSNKEISRILRKSEGSIRILQFRALKALKVELERMGVTNI